MPTSPPLWSPSVRILVERIGSHLVPCYPSDLEELETLAIGKRYWIEPKRASPRSIEQHNLCFSLFTMAAENHYQPITKEEVKEIIKIRTGHCKIFELNGDIIKIPGSISFHALPQDEFNIFFEKAITVLCHDFIPGLMESLARREVYKRAGVRQ